MLDVSRKDYLLEQFMSNTLTAAENLELHGLLRSIVADESYGIQDRLLASIVSRLMDTQTLKGL
jgi:hypothetical protein